MSTSLIDIERNLKYKEVVSGYFVTFKGIPYKIGGKPYYKTENVMKRYLCDWINNLFIRSSSTRKYKDDYFYLNGYYSIEGDWQEKVVEIKKRAKTLMEELLLEGTLKIEKLNHQPNG